MGYDSDRFLTPPPEKMLCSVCREVFKDPKELRCGHIMCQECLHHLRNEAGSFLCPLDRQESVTFDEPHQFFRESYYELRIKCQWHRFGCPEAMVIGWEGQHEQKCDANGHLVTTCPAGCGYTGPRVRPDDGLDHNCVSFLKDEMRIREQEHARRVYRLERRNDDLVEEIRAAQDKVKLVEEQRDVYVEKYYDETAGRKCRCRHAAGDA